MINKNMLKGLEPNISPTSYFTVINKIEQKEECNQESIVFSIFQIDKDLESTIENASVISKELTITSGLELSEDNFYRTKLVGYCVDKDKITQIPQDNSSHVVEITEATLSKSIELKFENKYSKIPGVIVNIDQKYLSYYKEYKTSYLQDEDEKYIGVIITFEKLKSKAIYPEIRIIIIGDPILNESEENSNDTNTNDSSNSEPE